MKRTGQKRPPAGKPGLFRLKLLRSHAIFSLLTALLVALTAFSYMQRKLIESECHNLFHVLECRGARIANVLEGGAAVAQAVADRVKATAGPGIDGKKVTPSVLEERLAEAAAAWPDVRFAALFTEKGVPLASVGRPIPGIGSKTGGGGSPVRAASPLPGGVTVSDPKVSEKGVPHLRFTKSCGTLVLTSCLRVPRLADALGARVGLGRTGEAIIGACRKEEVILFPSFRRNAGKKEETIPLDREAARPFAMAAAGTKRLVRTEDGSGAPIFAAFQPIAGTDWSFVVKMDSSELKSPLWKAAFLILGSAALLVTLSIFLAVKRMGPIADLMVLWNRELEDQVVERTEELEKSESMYRLLTESVADGELIIQTGRTVYANRSFRNLVGFPEGSAEGRPFDAWVAPGDVEQMKQRDKLRTLGITPPPRYRLKLKNGHGERVHVEIVEKEIEHRGRPASLLSLRDIGAIRRLRMYETFLPTCSVCKSIRDDAEKTPGCGEWITLENYVLRHTEAQMSHTYCPSCERELLGVPLS